MNNNLKIAIVVCITIALMGLAYSLFLSPHARCVNELNKSQPKPVSSGKAARFFRKK